MLLCASGPVYAQNDAAHPQARIDTAALVQPLGELCRDCHRAEYAVWERSQHARGFDTLHRSPFAREIADAMDEHLIKRDSICLDCHYTPVSADASAGAVLLAGGGVTCQSCHGEASAWLSIHYDFGVNGESLETAQARESAAHRQQRLAQIRDAGMVSGSDLYAMASKCFECHYIANEALIDTSRHPSGNPTFEFVSWSQSRIRHGVSESALAGNSPVSAHWTDGMKRTAYIVGRLVALEYSLRALAGARRPGQLSRMYVRRTDEIIEHLQQILDTAQAPVVRQVISVVEQVSLAPNNSTELLDAAAQIAAAGQAAARTNVGAGLQRIDDFIAAAAEHLPLNSQPLSEAERLPSVAD